MGILRSAGYLGRGLHWCCAARCVTSFVWFGWPWGDPEGLSRFFDANFDVTRLTVNNTCFISAGGMGCPRHLFVIYTTGVTRAQPNKADV